jgi:hypothetical protein
VAWLNPIKKQKVLGSFLKVWFPRALKELNAHYQLTGCSECRSLLVEAKEKFSVKFGVEGGEKPI